MSFEQLLLISNSRSKENPYLGHAESTIRDFLGSKPTEVLFIPYAAISISFDEYSSMVRKRFQEMGYKLLSIHETSNPHEAVKNSQTIVVGGGNTFRLLGSLYELDLLETIREHSKKGIPYIGWSAGANIACPTIKTTNDMPVVWPHSLDALNLVPFQINPHYIDLNPPGFSGETRAERIAEFTILNRNIYVVGLQEGSILTVRDSTVRLSGDSNVKVFCHGKPATEYTPSDALDFLLKNHDRFNDVEDEQWAIM